MIYKMNTELNFGKYKNLTIYEVLDLDPDYLEWALDTIDWFEVDEEVEKVLQSYDNLPDDMDMDELGLWSFG